MQMCARELRVRTGLHRVIIPLSARAHAGACKLDSPHQPFMSKPDSQLICNWDRGVRSGVGGVPARLTVGGVRVGGGSGGGGGGGMAPSATPNPGPCQ
jgi:hypothetical protein